MLRCVLAYSLTPSCVKFNNGETTFCNVWAGNSGTIARTHKTERIYVWGLNASGQLGPYRPTCMCCVKKLVYGIRCRELYVASSHQPHQLLLLFIMTTFSEDVAKEGLGQCLHFIIIRLGWPATARTVAGQPNRAAYCAAQAIGLCSTISLRSGYI